MDNQTVLLTRPDMASMMKSVMTAGSAFVTGPESMSSSRDDNEPGAPEYITIIEHPLFKIFMHEGSSHTDVF
jgi:hypothetical protein